MKNRLRIPLLGLAVLIIAALACSVGGSATPPETAVAETLAAFLTASPPGAPTATEAAASATPVPPTASKPSDTPGPTNTPGVQGCIDDSKFVADVTVPDNTEFAPGAAFTKTWRIQNTGTCTWVSAYALAFLSGDHLAGPASVAIVGNVAPGSMYEVSIDLVAPPAPGTYKGTWQMHNADGAYFGTKPYVQIVVPQPTATPTNTPTITPTPTPVTIVLAADGSNTGSVRFPPPMVFGAPNAGDDSANAVIEGFVTFNLSSIPSGATITDVSLDLVPFDTLGLPFSLGCLRVYKQDYGTLDASDFYNGSPLGALLRFCNASDIIDPTETAMDAAGIFLVQNALASGQFQIRLQFNEISTNNNNVTDLLRPLTPKLVVTYIVG